ncbi:hypothetical protein IMZ48_26325 [Candidatus Bathyarchaeota archaeon]|nr:hypothetical protein [Candidatus Bathyarchaeota archaeon]
MSEAPAEVLKEARQRILGLMGMGISREALMDLVANSSQTSPASNVPQQPLPTQSTDEVSREVKTERPADDGGLSRCMFFHHGVSRPRWLHPPHLPSRVRARLAVRLLTCE